VPTKQAEVIDAKILELQDQLGKHAMCREERLVKKMSKNK
jgi:hypothetical protein